MLLIAFLAAMVSMALVGCESLAEAASGYGIERPLDEETIRAGLKEALRIGSEQAVELVSREDGFLSRPEIRIPLPQELDDVATTLRDVGLGSLVDRFEETMNRAAERAAPEALGIFRDAIADLSIQDARNILQGGPHAATDLFELRTRDRLFELFLPEVRAVTDRVELTSSYKVLMDAYHRIPFVQRRDMDLDRYVTRQALDGLFLMLGREEARIRDDPVARVTELLRRVFGRSA